MTLQKIDTMTNGCFKDILMFFLSIIIIFFISYLVVHLVTESIVGSVNQTENKEQVKNYSSNETHKSINDNNLQSNSNYTENFYNKKANDSNSNQKQGNFDEYDSNEVKNKASQQLLTEDDLVGLSKRELRLMRNEIFARHGYIFKSEDLQDYFKKKSWYIPQYDDVSDKLSSIEKQNIEFIKKHE